MARLTEKQKRFADEYLVDLNATAAAARAGYKDPSIGRQLIAKNHVLTYVQRRRKDQERRTEVTQDRVLSELAAVAFSRGTDYAQVGQLGDVEIIPTGNLTDQQKAAVTGIKETQNGVEVKLADKVKALELIGKHLGMFDGQGSAAEDSADDPITASLREEYKK